MLTGIILYISFFKSEIGSKMKPIFPNQEEVLFTYRYGYSFVLYVVGILLVFCSGILNVFLYTSFHSEPTLIRPSPKSSPCFSYRKYHKVTAQKNSISSPAHRYVIRKDPNCNVHASQQVAKSLNQLYTEPAPDVAPYPCSVLTRSVSTLTDDLSPRKKHNGGNFINNMCGMGRSLIGANSPKKQKTRPKDIYYIEHNGEDDLSNVFVIEPIESFQRRKRSFYEDLPRRISNHSLNDLDKVVATDYSNFDTQYYDKFGSKAANSRTLPRNFVQKNFRFEDSRRVSASGIFQPNE